MENEENFVKRFLGLQNLPNNQKFDKNTIKYIIDHPYFQHINQEAIRFAIRARREKASVEDVNLAIDLYIKKYPERPQKIFLEILFIKLNTMREQQIDLGNYIREHLNTSWERLAEIYSEYKNTSAKGKKKALKKFIIECVKIIGKFITSKVI